ncbi:MAG: magnesium transporter CorA [Candidatus Micrarchaeota archaeon]|nr:magnesium transporter CorA [Candidatus Micrarchaeota archaeon]
MSDSSVQPFNAFSDEKNPYRARGFCGAIAGGKTQNLRSEWIEDFKPIVSKAQIAWVDYIIDDFGKEAAKTAVKMGFSENLIQALLKNKRSGYEDFETEMGLVLPAIHVKGFEVILEPQLILIRKNMLLTLHTRETTRFAHIRRYAEKYLKKLPSSMKQNDKLTMLLIRILDESNSRNFDHLQEIEECGDTLSQDLSNSSISRTKLGGRIYQMKHALIVYLSGLWATADALSSLRYGDAELITDDQKILDRISALVSEVHAQINLAEHLSDVLASGLEVLQSIYNNQLQILNNRLALLVAYLTIIGTALLVPNTIATVMGNAMFEFAKQDIGWYIALIIVSTIVATMISWFAVKKLGLLPSKPDSSDD